jgi:hypothetical protein
MQTDIKAYLDKLVTEGLASIAEDELQDDDSRLITYELGDDAGNISQVTIAVLGSDDGRGPMN